MSWDTLTPTVRTIAETTLTQRQLEVLKLHLGIRDIRPMGYRRIALVLGISVATVREHLDAAERKLLAHPDYPKEPAA